MFTHDLSSMATTGRQMSYVRSGFPQKTCPNRTWQENVLPLTLRNHSVNSNQVQENPYPDGTYI